MQAARDFVTPAFRESWQRVQNLFARSTGLALWTIDPEGKVIGRPSSPPALCLLLRAGAGTRALCNDDCIMSCRRAIRNNTTIFFRCHADLLCFAAPLRSSGRPVGVILGGQMLTGPPALERFKALARDHGLPEDKLVKALGELTIGNEKSLRAAADFVAETAELVFTGWEGQSRTSRRLTLLTNLFRFSSDFSPQMESHQVNALILNSLAVLFDLENAALLVGEPEGEELAAMYAFGPLQQKLMALRLARDQDFVKAFYDGGTSFSTDDYYLLLRAGFPEEVKQATLLPLFTGEFLAGLLAIVNRPLDREETELVGYFANQSSVVLQNAALRRDLSRRMRMLASMAAFNEKLTGAIEMDKILGIIFEEASRMARAEKASLMVLDDTTRELMVKLVKGGQGEVLRNYHIPVGQGPAGMVASLGEPMLVKNLERDERVGRRNRPNYKTSSFVILPLKIGSRTVGVLNITDRIDGKVYDEADLEMLRNLATQATVALERSELYELSLELKKISITDPLTGLLNRRYFQERATEEIERSRRYGQPLSLMMIDVDDFKFYNGQHGHPAGDEVLKNLGVIIKSTVRNIDVIARYGGEEFAVLCPSSDREQAMHMAERLRHAVCEHVFPLERRQPGGELTISAGVATFPMDASSLEELISHSDKALYLSKKAGKNRSTAFHV